MWPYTCMILIFYSNPTVSFFDATKCIFMAIQLHLSHTLIQCETRFMQHGNYRPPYDVNFLAKER